jgi:hypothetical protein
VDEDKKRYAAIASIILGFVNVVVGLCLPPCGGVLVIGGVVLAIIGIRSEAKLIGWIGIGINGIALLVVIAAQAFNIMLATGQIQMHDVVERLSGRELESPTDDDGGIAPPDADADAGPELVPWPDEAPVVDAGTPGNAP